MGIENCVGNGGFSLRSRKLLKTIAKINYDPSKFRDDLKFD